MAKLRIRRKKQNDQLQNSHESSNLAVSSIKTIKYDYFLFRLLFYLDN